MVDGIEAERGPFDLFGLFQRDTPLGLWDVVVAAPWVKGPTLPILNYLSERLNAVLTDSEIIQLSAIIPLERRGDTLRSILGLAREAGTDNLRLENVVLNGMLIERGYILRARPAAAKPAGRSRGRNGRQQTGRARRAVDRPRPA